MSDLMADSDAILIHRLFGPDAAVYRAGLDAEVVAEINDAAVDVLEGKNISDLPEEDAEHLSRQLAARIRAVLGEHVIQLQADASALTAEAKRVDAELDRIREEKAEIERRLQEGDKDGA